MRSIVTALAVGTLFAGSVANAATADEWKGKSIYQLITDRFAPPSDTAPARTSPLPADCDPALQTWCGGTWLSIIDKLDYIHGMGMDAIWISPTSKNIDVYTPYNYAYHGYWVLDPHEINPRFGSEDDLHALVEAVHARGMYIMVDVVVNNIPSLRVDEYLDSAALEAAGSMWTKQEYFHPQCWIDYSNVTSVQQCWLGDDKVALMDVNTEHPDVIDGLHKWIADYVSTYKIDGLRIDAAKHVAPAFWPGFCEAAGVFCIGEVYGDDLAYAVTYQTDKVMDAILGFPLYYGITAGFGTPMGNMSHFVDVANQVLQQFPRPDILGNFIENHDLPRWRNTTVDPQLAYNAMVAQFVFDGLPVVYYGQEQDFSDGANDPYNRQALWPSNFENTTTYQRIGKLNQVRHGVISNGTTFGGKTFLDYKTEILASSQYDVAIRKGPLLAVLTNRGSPSQDATFGVSNIGWDTKTTLLDVLSCRTVVVMADQSISISYAEGGQGGMPYLFMTTADATPLGLCGLGGLSNANTGTTQSGSSSGSSGGGGGSASASGSGGSGGSARGSAAFSQIAPHPAVVGAGVLVLVAAGAFGRRFA